MQTMQASRTAMMAAIARGQHRQRHAPEWVLDDPYALSLVGSAWPAMFDSLIAGLGEEVVDRRSALFARARAMPRIVWRPARSANT